ncbi:MAG TPA: hypothetical protein VL326_32270 [Kofleriaceae bacterium]|nr:hypothetical protein [Kofleriaceae bacterium]
MRARWALSFVVLAACGHPGSGGDPDGNTNDADGMTDGGDAWKMLISRQWSAIAGSEEFDCRGQQVTEDMYISGFRALAPSGTHHTLLTIDTDHSAPVGNFDCNGLNIADAEPLLYGGGLGTNDFLFPQGVAIKIPAGSWLQLYLHIENTSDATETETSGVEVQTVPASDVVHEADMFFVGKRMFTVPENMTVGAPVASGTYSLTTSCGSVGDWHILGMWPHMHEHATHQKVAITRAGNTMSTPLDIAFDFKEQRNYAMDFVVPANDRFELTCTWLNDTGYVLPSGDSAGAEMCYAGAYVYPKLGNLYTCVNQ